MQLKVLDLFSGIGGFSLGLERTGGFKTVAFCEIDEKSRKVLQKHWPDVHMFKDVKQLTGEVLYDTLSSEIDVITGGFPCQDISFAGRGAGLQGERSGLWYEFHRLIKEVRPKYAIIENVSALRSRGLDAVLYNLAEIGYDVEWHCIPASSIGAPHRRDRVWIIAYMADSEGDERERVLGESEERGQGSPDSGIFGNFMRPYFREFKDFWKVEPPVGRVVDGVPGRVDRLKQLGNAVVPQVVQLIGMSILEREKLLK